MQHTVDPNESTLSVVDSKLQSVKKNPTSSASAAVRQRSSNGPDSSKTENSIANPAKLVSQVLQ